jgi:hypothetical protein
MKKKTETRGFMANPKRKRKGVHSKNSKPSKKYRGQGR